MATVVTKSGKVKGIEADGLHKYLGIPFAEPPVGDLRFKRAIPVTPWEGTFEATTYGDPAAQNFNGSDIGSLDCLTLNVVRPEAGEKLPVFLWIHGGGYMTGSADDPLYHGDAYAKDGVLYVSIQYRLNIFGIYDFSTYPGCEDLESNRAISDMVVALQWVRDNIEAFGGDPNRITIGGESAGGSAVVTLMAVPAVKGCFQQVIAQSALVNCVSTKTLARENMDLYIEGMGWTEADLHKLRTQDPHSLIKGIDYVGRKHQEKNPGMFLPSPVIDDLLPERPLDAIAKGCASDVALIIGSNLNEGTMFVHPENTGFPNAWDMVQTMLKNNGYGTDFEAMKAYYDRPELAEKHGSPFVHFATDYAFEIPAIQLAQAQAAYNKVWMYRYEFLTEGGKASGMLVSHAFELPVIFGVKDHPFSQMVFGGLSDETVDQIVRDMRTPWVAFIKGQLESDSSWPLYQDESSEIKIFDHTTRLEKLQRTEALKLWADKVFYQA